jgi:RNA polymerase sigma factor (sigma-70 family)
MADTDDLVQEALLGTIRNLGTFQNRSEWALQAYLRSAVMNRVRNEIARFRTRPRPEEITDDLVFRGLSPLEEAVGAQVFERYESSLNRLSDVEREGVIARLELGCSFQEIAALLEKPNADAARMTVSRALTKLASLMKPA